MLSPSNNDDARINSIHIIGGAEAAWMAAACLAKALSGLEVAVTVITLDKPDNAGSDFLEPVFTGGAPLRAFHTLLGLDHDRLARATGAIPNLGTRLIGFSPDSKGDFVMSSGEAGASLSGIGFHHFMVWLHNQGYEIDIEDFDMAALMGRNGRFTRPVNTRQGPVSSYTYGANYDAKSYCEVLRACALDLGVHILAVKDCVPLVVDGHIRALNVTTSQGQTRTLLGQFFVDASAGHGWMRQHLNVGLTPLAGFGLKQAHSLTRVPQPKPGLLNDIKRDGRSILSRKDCLNESFETRFGDGTQGPSLSYQCGRLTQFWHGNCVAIGAAAGQLEPLGTSMAHFIQMGITQLLAHFPSQSRQPALEGHYNHILGQHFDRQADALLCVYILNGLLDMDFAPEALKRKLKQFKSRGRVVMFDHEGLSAHDWARLLLGLGVCPDRYDPRLDGLDSRQVQVSLQRMQAMVAQEVQQAPLFMAGPHP